LWWIMNVEPWDNIGLVWPICLIRGKIRTIGQADSKARRGAEKLNQR
jgi:hypothetical protein